MQGDIEKLRRELQRLRRPLSALITPTPGGPSVEVRPGDTVEFMYEGQTRRVRVLAIMRTAIRAWDLEKSAIRAFGLAKIGREPSRETDTAASG